MPSVSQKLFTSLGQGHEFEMAMIKQGVTPDKIQGYIAGKFLISFYPAPQRGKPLTFKQLLAWLKKNGLEGRLSGGLEAQIAEQEKFYKRFYGKDFYIRVEGISVDPGRLPAIKAGLENGCLNYSLVKVTPDFLTVAQAQMTEAEFFFEMLMKPLKKEGFKIWAESGTDRWTNLTLLELLQRGIPVEPEDFDAEAFKKDWMSELGRVIAEKGPAPKVQAGVVELIFTSDMVDIPRNQKIVNKVGEIVEPDGRSYVSAVAKKVRVCSRAEEIVLACQLFARGKTYLAHNTRELRRDVVWHKDKGVNPPCSVACAYSVDRGFFLCSDFADWSSVLYRLRLAL